MTFPIFNDERGNLLPIEFKDLPFIPVRAFVVSGVPVRTWRGNHAHYRTSQLLICLSGTIEYHLDHGRTEVAGTLGPGDSVLVKPMTWDKQQFMSEDAYLLVLCNTTYDRLDYIEDYHVFMRLVV